MINVAVRRSKKAQFTPTAAVYQKNMGGYDNALWEANQIRDTALWSRSAKNPDVSSVLLACPFAYLLVHAHSSLICLLYTTLFATTLCRAHLFACSVTNSVPSSWKSESLDAGTKGGSEPQCTG